MNIGQSLGLLAGAVILGMGISNRMNGSQDRVPSGQGIDPVSGRPTGGIGPVNSPKPMTPLGGPKNGIPSKPVGSPDSQDAIPAKPKEDEEIIIIQDTIISSPDVQQPGSPTGGIPTPSSPVPGGTSGAGSKPGGSTTATTPTSGFNPSAGTTIMSGGFSRSRTRPGGRGGR